MPTPVQSLVVHPNQDPKVIKKKPTGKAWVADAQETIFVPVPSHSDYLAGAGPVLTWNATTGATVEHREKLPTEGKVRIAGIHLLVQDSTFHPYMDKHNKRFDAVTTAKGNEATALVIGYNRHDEDNQLYLETADNRTPKQIAVHMIERVGCTDVILTHHGDHYLCMNGAEEVSDGEEPYGSSQPNETAEAVIEAEQEAPVDEPEQDEADEVARRMMAEQDEERDDT